jgi:hypothetical protein
MTQIRHYTEEDFAALKRMHARQGFDYELPDLNSGIWLEKLVQVDGEGKIVMAALLRMTAEAYFLHEPEAGTPKQRWERFLVLHEVTRARAMAGGLADVYCWLPPEVAPRRELPEKPKPRGFERKLEGLGWQSCRWRCYTRKTQD